MDLKPRFTMEVFTGGLVVLCALLAVLVGLLEPRLLWVLIPLAALVALAVLLLARRLRRGLARVLQCEKFENSQTQLSLGALTLPVALLSGKTLVWYNTPFRQRILADEDRLLAPVGKVLCGLDLHQCGEPAGQVLEHEGRKYNIFASATAGREALTVLYLVDETDLRQRAAEYDATRPAYMIIEIDAYAEQLAELKDSEKARVLEGINRVLETYIGRTTGFLQRVSNARYIAVVEERHMKEMVAAKFDVLDKIRALEGEVNVTLSIGVGRGGDTLRQCEEMARQSLDMALGRGGDQAAVKTPEGFAFYGGVSRSVEKRSRVKSRIVAKALCDLIRQADSVLIMGHRMSDLDCVGAAIGVLRICKGLDAPAAIVVRREATLAQSVLEEFQKAGLGEDFISPEVALDGMTDNTLLLVVDTHIKGLLESGDVYRKCRQVAVIDHHRKAVGHIDNAVLFFHEPYASSTCELVSELLQYVEGQQFRPTQLEAEALLAGIMLDTRNFGIHTGVRTFEAAAYLRRMGAMTERVKLLFNSSLQEYTAKSNLVENADIYMGCAVSVSGELPPDMAVAVPQAANDLLTIQGVGASFVAVQQGSGVNISARSMGAVNVQVIMEQLGGGGHLTMAGAQLKDTTIDEAEKRIRQAIARYRQEQAEEEARSGKKR